MQYAILVEGLWDCRAATLQAFYLCQIPKAPKLQSLCCVYAHVCVYNRIECLLLSFYTFLHLQLCMYVCVC